VSTSKSAVTHQIKRQSLPESLAESLRERILNGEFREGDALIQDALAQEYDVSRMPVREALRQLEADGLVAMRIHRGAVVTSVPTGQIEELFELRALLECELLARAIPKLTDKDLSVSRKILAELGASYERHDIANWGRLNWEFHRSLYGAADRAQTLAIVQGINVQTDRYIRLHLLLTHRLDQAEEDHREILRLSASRNVKGAVAYLKKHILIAGGDLVAALRTSRAADVVRLA
jgi:DNA-binding GntR family transcriptional regulator